MGSLRLYNHTNAEMEEEYVKRVITYGTFDMLHYGHINILRRAKEMGDYLVVVLSTDEFNWNSKQKGGSIPKSSFIEPRDDIFTSPLGMKSALPFANKPISLVYVSTATLSSRKPS